MVSVAQENILLYFIELFRDLLLVNSELASLEQ